jgi:predicted DNA-binding transcriptional regulator YafY
MAKRDFLQRYIAIINYLRNKGAATFDEISAALERESEISGYRLTVSKRTFQRDLDDIASLYNVEVAFDFSEKVYRILFDEENPGLSQRMLEAFDVMNLFNISGRLSSHILFENRRPEGTEHFRRLLHAIHKRLAVRFTYTSYFDVQSSSRTAEPLALKESRFRWYLLARDSRDDKLKSFGLDRIRDLNITGRRFSYPSGFDPAVIYRDNFGIINKPGAIAEEVVLSFDSYQGRFIKSFPLHHSQQMLHEDADEIRFRLKLQITEDFIMELLSYGDEMHVIAPASLRNHLENIHQNALSRLQTGKSAGKKTYSGEIKPRKK